MDARSNSAAWLLATLAAILVAPDSLGAGTYRTKNFSVQAATPQLARELGEAAEVWRERLAIEWLGKPLPDWSEACKLQADVSPRLGAGGWTTFVFDQGRVYGWDMHVQGSRERVLDSVLPHEITHTIFASYFRQPLPRWADEGACTTVEHRSEIGKQEALLINFLKTGKGIAFRDMFAMTEYPSDVLPLYAQGLSLTQFLLERRGKQEFLAFLADGMRDDNWGRAVAARYGHNSLYELQDKWLTWVKAGRPRLALEPDVATMLASSDSNRVQQVSATTPSTVDPGPAQLAVAPSPAIASQAPRSAGRPSVYEVTPEARAAENGVRDARLNVDQPTLLR